MAKKNQKRKVIAVVNIFALGILHGINRMISSSAVLKNILKPATGSYYTWKFGKIFYRKEGSGKPLLLIHDLNPISSGYEWSKLVDKLKKNHTVYTIDLLGCGRSEKPGLTYTNYLYVQMITDFIHDVIGEKTDVAATGLSSSFVTMAAHKDPELFERILMFNPVSLKKLDQTPTECSKILKHLIRIPILGTAIYHIETCHQNMEYQITEKYIYNPFRVQQKLLDAYYEAAHYGKGNGKYLYACLDGFYLNINIRAALSKLKNPVHIIYGEKMDYEKEISESYRKIKTDICLSPIYGTKFLPQLETPEETYTKMEAFLS